MTMNASLDSARFKVARAEEHLHTLERQISAYLNMQPCELIHRFRAIQPVPAVRTRVPPPLHLSAIAGDCLYNLHASLELTFWALALQTGPKDSDRDRISFPILANESKFRAAYDGFARYISAEALGILEEVQPFRTRNVALSILRTLSNKDKHGFPGLTIATIAGADQPTACVSLDDSTVPLGNVDAVLEKILPHISAEVLPKFEPLCS